MRPEDRERYLKAIEPKLKTAERLLVDLEDARNTSESPMTSRYDSQRHTFAEQVSIQQDLLRRIRLFREFLEHSPPRNVIELGAQFTAELWDADDILEDAIYAPVVIDLEGVPVVTPSSPIGDAIKGMRAGNTFVYRVGGKLMSGIIKAIS